MRTAKGDCKRETGRVDTGHTRKSARIWRTGIRMALLLLVLVLAMSGCGQTAGSSSVPAGESTAASSVEAAETTSAETSTALATEETTEPVPSKEPVPVPTMDRAGTAIEVPEEVNRIVSLAPSFTESLIAMGVSDRIVGIDMNAVPLEGVDPSWPVFDLMAPDTEKLLALEPDVLLATPLSMGGGEDPFKLLREAGICVIYVPSSDSIAGIEEDLLFLGAVFGTSDKAQQLVEDMQASIDEIAAIGATVTEKKRVHFEISAAPYIYSFGRGVFLDEMLTLIGAENVYADQESWISVADEVAMAKDPDVILTNVAYIPDAVGEIKARQGWSEMAAVKNDEVYYIDNMSSSLPNQNIVKALRQMAEAIYPELY